MKKTLSLLLAAALCLSLTVPALSAGSPYNDVATTHWAYAAIVEAYNDGAITGTSYNENTGVRLFSPNSPVTLAQFITIMTRAFYGDQVEASKATGKWYSRNLAVAEANGLLDGLEKGWSVEAACSRYQMAAIMSAVMENAGMEKPSPAVRVDSIKRISDWGSISAYYRNVVADVFALGIITGYEDNSFGGTNSMNRAQAATVYSRLKAAMAKGGGEIQRPEVETPELPPEAAPIGTISDTPVKLALETHSVDYLPVDYWAEQSAEIKELTKDSRQAFNSFVHCLVNRDVIFNGGQFGTGLLTEGINLYYHYPVYKPSYASLSLVEQAPGIMYYTPEGAGCTSSDGLWFFGTGNPEKESFVRLQSILKPYLDKITPGMSDRDKANLMAQCIVDKLDYQTGVVGATWENGLTVGDCTNFSGMAAQLFVHAGIPNIEILSDEANHAWNQVYLADEGEWVIYDLTHKENGGSGVFSFEAHAKKVGYSNGPNVHNNLPIYKIARAIIETACKYSQD